MTMQLNDVRVERGEGGMVTMQIEVAPSEVQSARARVIKDLSRRIRVSGFRPGHIPANIVRRQVGDESIAQSVSDELVPLAYQAALAQADLQPLDRAQVDELFFDAFDGEKPLQFTARVVVRPTIEIGEYKGLTATKPAVEVTDDDIERGLQELRSQRATMRDVADRGAQNGDILNAELRVFIDGEARGDGEPARLRSFTLGESGFIPPIDEHLLDARLDDERRFPVTYPEDFNDGDLAGKEAEFAVKVTSLKERVLPELNDEFAVSVGLEDMAGVRERMREAIQDGRERESREAVRSTLAQAALATAQFETPSSLVDSRVARRLENIEGELTHRGATLEEYLTSLEKTREEFDADLRSEVETEVRGELVLDEIARRENLTAEPEEIEHHYHQVAAAMNQPVEEIVKRLDIESARASIQQRKAVDHLVLNAVVTDESGATVEESSDVVDASDAAQEVGTPGIAQATEETPATLPDAS